MFLVGRHRNSEINVGFKFYFSVTMTSFPETKGKLIMKLLLLKHILFSFYKNGEISAVSFSGKKKFSPFIKCNISTL